MIPPTAFGPRKGVKRRHAEDDLHEAVAAFLSLALPAHVAWTTIGHGGFKLPIHVAARMKKRGVHAGWPDLIFVHPDTGRAFFVELKADAGETSREQKAVHNILLNSHSPVTVARSVSQVEHFLRAFNFPLQATCGGLAA